VNVRSIAPRPGRHGWAHAPAPYQLPDVLADQTPLTVIRTDGISLTVEDAQGREWILQHWLVDCGFEFFLHGRWLHESDTAVLGEIEQILVTNDFPAISPDGVRYREWLKSILRRHGHDPESRS
jgi:hypothetical protein